MLELDCASFEDDIKTVNGRPWSFTVLSILLHLLDERSVRRIVRDLSNVSELVSASQLELWSYISCYTARRASKPFIRHMEAIGSCRDTGNDGGWKAANGRPWQGFWLEDSNSSTRVRRLAEVTPKVEVLCKVYCLSLCTVEDVNPSIPNANKSVNCRARRSTGSKHNGSTSIIHCGVPW